MVGMYGSFFTVRNDNAKGFTIVELLIVIVVIGILAAITIVAYNGIQDRARTTSRDADISQYYKAVIAARTNTGTALRYITGSAYSMGNCVSVANNPSATEPKDLAKTHVCWTSYYNNLNTIGTAANMNLDSLKDGDPQGNPYVFDENEGENCSMDQLRVFSGSGVTVQTVKQIPRLDSAC